MDSDRLQRREPSHEGVTHLHEDVTRPYEGAN